VALRKLTFLKEELHKPILSSPKITFMTSPFYRIKSSDVFVDILAFIRVWKISFQNGMIFGVIFDYFSGGVWVQRFWSCWRSCPTWRRPSWSKRWLRPMRWSTGSDRKSSNVPKASQLTMTMEVWRAIQMHKRRTLLPWLGELFSELISRL